MVNLLPENINAVLTTTCACTVAVLVTGSGIVQNLKLGSVPTTPVLTQILIPTLILTTPAPITTPEVPMPMPNLSRPSLTITLSTPTQVPLLHLEVASTVQCTTPKTKDKKDATKGACAVTW